MILTLLLLATAVEPTQLQADEIVVTAQKLNTWKGKFAVRGTKASCRTTKSTGDRELDGLGCQAMLTCLPPLQQRVIATDAKDLDPAVRKVMKASVTNDMVDCLKARRDVLVADLVERRYEARHARN